MYFYAVCKTKLNIQISRCELLNLKIDKSVLSIDNIYDTEINGTSLPLKIYKDNENVCGRGGIASSQFHSLILPSI